MELKLLLTLLRRWFWLLLLGLLLGAGGGYLASQYQQPVYQATTKVMVIKPQESSVTADLTLSDQELMQTYVTLLTTRPVLQAASEELGFGVSGNQITARQASGTRLLEITVRANNPERAANIANTLVDVLIQHNDQLQSSRFASSEESLQAQIAQVEQQIADAQATVDAANLEQQENQEQAIEEEKALLEEQIFDYQRQIAVLESDIEQLLPDPPALGEEPQELSPTEQQQLVDMRTELSQLRFNLRLAEQRYGNLLFPSSGAASPEGSVGQQQASLELYRQLYANLLSAYESVRLARLQNTPNVVRVEAAEPASTPIQPRPVQNTLLGSAVGLILMGAIAFLIEYLDDSLKTPADINAATGLPVIGYLADANGSNNGNAGRIVIEQPRSPISEAFRSLRTNLEFAGVSKPLQTILITSPGPKDGKTTVATNLAAIMAQSGKRIILLDADLRRPSIHRILELGNRQGLSNLFRHQSSAGAAEAIQSPEEMQTLGVITSGSLPPNPAELLGSPRMDALLDQLRAHAEHVIIDSPPAIVSDPSVLAAKVDGVVIILQPGKTDFGTLQAMVEQLRHVEANIVGVVLNRIRSGGGIYGTYNYYSTYYNGDNPYLNGHGEAQEGKRNLRNLFGKSSETG